MSAFRTVPGDRPLRIVQVGAGGMGRAWLRTIADEPGAELVGLVDLNLETARAALAEIGLEGVALGTSAAQVAGETGADAVVNVTVPAAHQAVNREALAAGLPVLCEKPAAPTIADALRQAAAATVHGELLMISQSRRYFAALDALRAEVASLGRIGSVVVEFYKAPRFGGFREEMAHVLLVDMAIHQFDAARSVVGSEPVAVYCEEHNPGWSWYDGAANAHAVFEFAGGERLVYTGSWCAPGEETSWNGRWRVSGEYGTALWDGSSSVTSHRPDIDDAPLHADVAPGAQEETAGALAEFLSCLRSGVTPSGEARRNVHSLAMVEAAVRSSETGARVRIADVLGASLADAIAAETDPAVRTELERIA
ncbi:Gfo/Idh/MocA family protein [Microbacterium sp. G2-8]|uniref:Gfo/Idh/MocA family protein n=1 Tax=Microbacterium sp. G2-8 TaxID=2842454 RepID=UPI0021AA7FDC|nr:Gfo/Idh/MocA family oxidoreductase [Microbacterium sp. G2-8]